jgi:transcription antitermination factor NusG
MARRAYVAQTHGGLERHAQDHLKRQGFDTFLPEYRDGRMLRLFPGYIFLWFDVEDRSVRWQCVNSTRGVIKLLPREGLVPRALPDGFVEELRDRCAEHDWSPERAEQIAYGYAKGERVEVVCGPLAGYNGELIKFHKGSAILLMALLGVERKIPIPKSMLARRPDHRVQSLAVAS